MRALRYWDYEAVVELAQENAPYFDVTNYQMDRPVEEHAIFVAEDSDGRILGWIEGETDSHYIGPGADPAHPKPHGNGLYLVVDASARRMGVGRALTRAFARACSDAGCTWMFMLPDENDDVARCLQTPPRTRG
ncbi:GNAT family N-acetyltransferase [Nocardiopsis eucommiae]|uniref:GNAT family N-acetyltransferase n=1 Tax=Nocardiopsis eucommiae TaxID=2831970 RepID=A0A975LCL8_9ACTN|nr:GNAT family N-acetyltransferase [Nocardiopsis eucommiae]